MKKEALKRIFDFLEEKGEQNPPFMWKYMNNIPLTEDDLNIEGDLDLSGIEATSIPEGLKIKGNLNLSSSKITSLPRDLNIKGGLNLTNTSITSLPRDLNIKGDLNLAHTLITSLPEGLKVKGSLNLSFCKRLNSLPKGLVVGNQLWLQWSGLKDYSHDEIIEMIYPGKVKREKIFT